MPTTWCKKCDQLHLKVLGDYSRKFWIQHLEVFQWNNGSFLKHLSVTKSTTIQHCSLWRASIQLYFDWTTNDWFNFNSHPHTNTPTHIYTSLNGSCLQKKPMILVTSSQIQWQQPSCPHLMIANFFYPIQFIIIFPCHYFYIINFSNKIWNV